MIDEPLKIKIDTFALPVSLSLQLLHYLVWLSDNAAPDKVKLKPRDWLHSSHTHKCWNLRFRLLLSGLAIVIMKGTLNVHLWVQYHEAHRRPFDKVARILQRQLGSDEMFVWKWRQSVSHLIESKVGGIVDLQLQTSCCAVTSEYYGDIASFEGDTDLIVGP